MKQYTFIRTGGDKKHIEAMSLKKAIKKYDGKPNDHDNNVPSEIIFARTYTDVWFNLTIPDGVDVQDLQYLIRFFVGELKNCH